ncbi:hypothetical protein C8R44DRAFT_856606 [Mycena epipterygia]|nr:hypothetical protein C8R44DRAFT_856606 [Mycena epipterygia]
MSVITTIPIYQTAVGTVTATQYKAVAYLYPVLFCCPIPLTDMSVIVDDRDAQVHYSPPTDWISKGEGKTIEYNSTTIFAEHAGSFAELTFEGTSITVYATVDAGNGASMAFHVDQTPDTVYSAPATTSAIHHQALWTSDVLPQGTHTLFVTQESDSTSDGAQRIQLDYFIYNTTATAEKTLFVDDSDARVRYSTDWGTMSGEQYFQNATHFTALPGASISFTFSTSEGDFVSFYGPAAYGSSGFSANASAVIDGGKPVPAQLHHPSLAGNISFNNQIFKTGGLSAGNHTMVVTLLDDQLPLYIDYLLFGSTSPQVAQTVSPAGSQTSAPAISSASTLSSKSPNVGAIVGGAVGGLAVLALLIVGVLFFWRRRQMTIHFELPLERPPVGSPNSRWRQSTASSVTTLAGDDDLPEAERKSPARYLNDD